MFKFILVDLMHSTQSQAIITLFRFIIALIFYSLGLGNFTSRTDKLRRDPKVRMCCTMFLLDGVRSCVYRCYCCCLFVCFVGW